MIQTIFYVIYPYSVISIVGISLIWHLKVSDRKEWQRLHKKHEKKEVLLLIKTLFVSTILTGLCILLFPNMESEPIKLFNLVKSIVLLKPNFHLLQGLSLLSKIHFFLFFTFLFFLSFSKYITYIYHPTYVKEEIFKKRCE